MACVTAQAVVTGPAAAHPVAQAIGRVERFAETADPRGKAFRRWFEAIEQASPHARPIPPPQRLYQRPDRPGRSARLARRIHRGRRQARRRPHEHEIQRGACGDRLDLLAAAPADGRALGKKQRYVAPQFGSYVRQVLPRPSEAPDGVGAHQCRGRITRTPA